MNLSIVTGKIVSQPKLHCMNNQYYISFILYVKNSYNMNTYNLLFAYYNIKNISNFYCLYSKGQNIIVEGYVCKPQMGRKENLALKNYFKQFLWIKLYKLY